MVTGPGQDVETEPVTGIILDVQDVSTGKEIDQELDEALGQEESRLTGPKPEPPDKGDKAKAGPPRLDEWQDFFSRVLIRSATDWYVNWAFRGVDEDALSEREVNRITLEKEERDRIARPFAELANKSKFTRKHGRMIVSLTDSWDSLVAIGAWYTRVNRISRKYQRKVAHSHVSSRQGTVSPENSNGSPNGQGTYDGSVIGSYYGPGTG